MNNEGCGLKVTPHKAAAWERFEKAHTPGGALEHAAAQRHLSGANRRLAAAIAIPASQPSLKMHSTISAMHSICEAIERAREKLCEHEIRQMVEPSFRALAEAPFVRRLQEWPRGYPGDYETIEMICDGTPGLPPDHSHYWIEWYALNAAIAQQHRNKIDAQRHFISNGLVEGANVLSVGCGGGRDLVDTPAFPRNVSFYLVDHDADALTVAAERARRLGKVNTICNDALKAVRGLRHIAFDRIVFGGLFDYLGDRVMVALLKCATKMLSDSGSIMFTNVSTHSHFGTFVETMARWPLKLRSQSDIEQLLQMAGINPEFTRPKRDTSGLSLIVEIYF